MEQIQDTLNYFMKKGFLLDRELLDFFNKLDNKKVSEDILNRISVLSKTRIITKAMLAVHFGEVKTLFLDISPDKKTIVDGFLQAFYAQNVVIAESPGLEIKKKQILVPNVKILSSNIIPYRKITVEDFIMHFKNRYNFLKDILKTRESLKSLVSINKIGNSGEVSVIGLVVAKRMTKNKNLMLEIEDLTGRVSAIINQTKPELFEKAKEILLDDVIGLRCIGSREILFVNDIVFAESTLPEKKKCNEEVYAIFTSDMHIGSKHFLKENFERFIGWLNGEGCDEITREKISKIKYMFIVGDNVDGVGVNPGQEERLLVKDIREQYKLLAGYLERVPKRITMIMCPGQHDAVRVPEPQPPMDAEFAEPLLKIDNLILVSNPAFVEIGCNDLGGGFKVLMYHGASFHDWIDEVENLRMSKANLNPAKVVKYILRHRHLSPTHSRNTYVPGEKEDTMVVKEAPDIVATGDMHRSDIDVYNNTLIICSSCWQSITPFEEKVGNIPDPCKVPILNLKTREIKILDFS